jgi:hypothetical protein
MTLTMKCGVAALALVLAGCGSDDDARAVPATSAVEEATTTSTVADDVLKVTATGKGPLPTFGEQTCADAGTPCVLPARGSQTWSGDLEGNVLSLTGGTAHSSSGVRFVAARLDVFTGTVKGCGTGSFVLVGREIVNATEGGGAGEIVDGFGTGDLANLTGTFEGEGGVVGDGIQVEWRGELKCEG